MNRWRYDPERNSGYFCRSLTKFVEILSKHVVYIFENVHGHGPKSDFRSLNDRAQNRFVVNSEPIYLL